jgi:hypothetical protein
MVSCQEPSRLKGSKHSSQCHPHDAALVNALSFVSMGVEARCHPCHSTAHCRHMKRQPCLHHCRPHRGRLHCDRRRHLHHHCQLRCHRRCHRHCHRRCHRPLPLPSAIAIADAVDHHRRRLCCVAISPCHCRCRHPCHRPLPSPSPLAIAVAISVGHHHHRRHRPFPRVVALVRRELYLTN